MKADIHPDYHEITVQMTDGTKFKTRSVWGKEGETLILDVDPKTHPAWSDGKNTSLRRTGQMDKFANKFGSLDFGALSGKGGAAASSEKKSEKKDKKDDKKSDAE
ncbi:MAG: 50S ribosomal protein L31 [Rickettsiales bacterium]